MFPSTLGKTKLTVSSGSYIKCIVSLADTLIIHQVLNKANHDHSGVWISDLN